eukprot:jgi/Tetstr1/460711/TSEL_005898.t1
MCKERGGMVCAELKSPPPPNELRMCGFKTGLAAAQSSELEVSVLLDVLRHLGVAAPDTSERGTSAMTHCHVNVCNSMAGGELLNHRDILYVWQAWVIYEFVTVKFARSWLWRDRWAAPLLATGAEFVFQQKPWEQGRVLGTSELVTNDVPAFVRHCHTTVRSHAFASCQDEQQRLAMLFAPGKTPGKHVSLNVNHVTSFGTLEFRRMHSTTSSQPLLQWLQFCSAFVDAFGSPGGRSAWPHFLDASEPCAALQQLQRAQHTATQAMLERDMGLPVGYLDTMRQDSCYT